MIKRLARPLGLGLGSLRQYPPRDVQLDARDASQPVSGGPAFYIVTPAFNSARFIERTMQSVLTQNCPALHYAVVDGGSTDGTADMIRARAASLAWWCSEPDAGQTSAINKGFARLLSGRHGPPPGPDDVMAWLNADDVYLPGTINAVAAVFRDHPEVDVVYGHRICIDESRREIGRWFVPRHHQRSHRWACYVPQETMFWRARAWHRLAAPALDESFSFAMDWDLVVRLEDAGARFRALDQFLGAFTVHDSQKSIALKESTGRPEFHRLRARACGTGPEAIACRARNYLLLLRSMAVCWRWRLSARAEAR